MKPLIELEPNAPMVFCLDRTASMDTRDCPEGLTRWHYALGALREAMNQGKRENRRMTLITFGANVHVFENVSATDLEYLTHGDAACCVGQAASEAIYFAAATPNAPQGGVVIISDGLPDQDTRTGRVLLGSPICMRELFDKTCFLTVGKVPKDVEVFASTWPHHARLEDVMASDVNQSAPQESYSNVLTDHSFEKVRADLSNANIEFAVDRDPPTISDVPPPVTPVPVDDAVAPPERKHGKPKRR